MHLSSAQIQQFKIDGYLVLPSLIAPRELSSLKALAIDHLETRVKPFELETDVAYPGSPKSKTDKGGNTIRRLKMAYQRDQRLKSIAHNTTITHGIKEILQDEKLLLNPNHHNCIMTKQPQFSSETLWHRDTRYWNFNNKYLVNCWFAIGDERELNGAMKILPGSHRWDVADEALDSAQFLILDHPDNQQRLATQRLVELNAGDALLFSAHCFHAAGKNQTTDPKLSLVYTYHSEKTEAVANTHSANLPPINILD